MRRQCCKAAAASAGSHASFATPACARAWLPSAKICSTAARRSGPSAAILRILLVLRLRGQQRQRPGRDGQGNHPHQNQRKNSHGILDPEPARMSLYFGVTHGFFSHKSTAAGTASPAAATAGRGGGGGFYDHRRKTQAGNYGVGLELLSRGRVFSPAIRTLEGWFELVIAEIVARSDPDEQNDGRQCDDAGEQEEPYPADLL